MPPKTSDRTLRAGLLATTLAAGALSTFTSPSANAAVGDPAANGSYAYTARLTIGDNLRACTGALVDRYWVITAASCFADNPAQPTAVDGAPKWPTTVTVGRTDLTATGTGAATDVERLVARPDRDLVMAKLASPVDGITPLRVATTAPVPSEKLRMPGYGRTRTEWVPNKMHSGVFNLDGVRPSAVDTTGTNGAAVCKGDTGAPVVRENGGGAELVAVASRSWQGGCLGETETRTGAANTRTDDLGTWIDALRMDTAEVKAGTHVQITGSDRRLRDQLADYSVGWSETWAPVSDRVVTAVDSVAVGDYVHTYAVLDDGRVYDGGGRIGGKWDTFQEVPGGAVGATSISATTRGNGVVDLMIVGGDGSLHSTTADYNTGRWNPTWDKIGDNHLKAVTSAHYNNTTHIFAVNEDNRVYTRSAEWGVAWSDWTELRGGLPNVKAITASVHGTTIDVQIATTDAFYSTSGHFDTGQWDPQWTKMSDNKLKALTSTVSNNVVHVFAVNEDDKVYGLDGDYNAGKWSDHWFEIPGGAAGAKAITATSTR
ncbi:trypsin-like serine protease [Kitasatospora purpeofusca]|uniref:trypsin-like serine protease n=1 Tax=Kitasatospora purpeofusca TaxID=67352 RepID=UPI0035DBFA72